MNALVNSPLVDSPLANSLLFAHLPVLPVLLPLFTAVVLLIMGDGGGQASHGSRQLRRARIISMVSILVGALLAWQLMINAASGTLAVYRLGGWPAPFGIALVVDRLSALMLALTWTIALPVVWYAAGGWDAHGRYFHVMVQFLLMGLSGAFVTGDLFNLFVFFEVLLISSYVLLLHGQGQRRFRFGLHYVVLNLVASALFLIGTSVIYAVTGTLNMADLALRVGQLALPEATLLKAGVLVLLVVFGLKAAIVPLYMWLPGAYAAASAPVAALFAIMTKVGVYSIIRVHGVIFGDAAGHASLAAAPWLLPVALTTAVLGVLGALAATSLARMVGYLNIASVGIVLTAVGEFSPGALSAAIYYAVHSTLAIAALFLLVEMLAAQRGDVADRLVPAGPVGQPVMLGLMTLLAAASVTGLPPLPGFLGKVMILQSVPPGPTQIWIWTTVLLVGFLTLIGLARAGVILFWNTLPGHSPSTASGVSWQLTSATISLLGASLVLAAAASPLKRYADAAALQLSDRNAYARAVLGPGALTTPTMRPYRAGDGEIILPQPKGAP